MTGGVLWRWLDCSGVWATPGEAVREQERVPGCRPSSLCLPMDQSPSKGQGEAAAGPGAIKAMMAFDSNFFMSPQPQALPVVRSGASSCPLKHTNCAHKSHSMVSLCSGSVFVHVWVREVRKQDWGVGWGSGGEEALPIVRRSWWLSQKVWMLFFGYSISSGKSPSHQGNILAEPCLDIEPNRKRCLRASQPCMGS